jgi:hypothetical protein
VPDWLGSLLLSFAWAPVLVVLHEAGHAFVALALTDGEVSMHMRGGGMLGGSVTYEESTLRRARDAAWIAAAGPAVTLAVAVVLWNVGLATGLGMVAWTGALLATVQFFTTALPLRYGAGLGGPADSDGRVIWRVLTGAPPGGIERELRHVGEPERAARPVFVFVLVAVGVLAVVLDPVMGAALVGLFGSAAILQSKLD